METGRSLPSRSIEITLEKMRRHSGPGKNVHTDQEVAEEHGLPAPVPSGIMMLGYVSDWLLGHFGDPWLSEGELDVKYVDIVLPGDTLVLTGTVEEDTDTEMRVNVECRVPAEDQDGDKVVIVGTAAVSR